MSFQKYRLQNTSFCKCLKSHVLVYPKSVNMLKGPKHCQNLRDSTWIAFVYYSEKYSVEKNVSSKYLKSSDRLLTHWIPRKSIFSVIGRTYRN